jgi:hypothetical protein
VQFEGIRLLNERTAMELVRRIASFTALLLVAASSATAEAPKVPAARFHHSGVYDEARKEFLICGGYTWDQGTNKLSNAWGWNSTTWQLIDDTSVRLEDLIRWRNEWRCVPSVTNCPKVKT